jgi:pimeloyl-ACP methyl ester carboxylesterase
MTASPAATARRVGRGVGVGLLVLLFAPLYLAFVVVFLAITLALTLTGIGPALQYWRSRVDASLLANLPGVTYVVVPAAGGVPAHRLAVRWTKGTNPTLPPVAIPNGLGATLISIGRLHDALVSLGFSVLSYDRAGVGLSDPLPPGVHHLDAAATVADMHAVLTHPSVAVRPGGGGGGGGGASPKWILVGPSMGSIVAQAYLAAHPDAAAGFLNVDGFPFPFAARRQRFERSAVVYRVVASLVWTGMLRPFLALAGSVVARIASPSFPARVVRAQMNTPQFYRSLGREMFTMMDCADAARAGWGPAFDLQTLSAEALAPLVCAQPHRYGDAAPLAAHAPLPQIDGGEAHGAGGAEAPASVSIATFVAGAGAAPTPPPAAHGPSRGGGAAAPPPTTPAAALAWHEQPRSRWERGADWAPRADTAAAVAAMVAANAALPAPAPLPGVFARLIVRVMSARSYDFAGGNAYYDDTMKDWAAAEHALHAALAADGARSCFPGLHHGTLFFGTIDYAARQVLDIGLAATANKADV